MKPEPARGEAGFTLIELVISLGLFALIAMAGLTLVNGILAVQGRTEVRLDRTAQLQRAMFVVTSDLDQVAPGRISGGGEALSFTRTAPGIGGAAVALRYALAGGSLTRGTGQLSQMVLPGVTAVRWRFRGEQGWVDRWPIDEKQADLWPRAIELEMEVSGAPSGSLRRVVALPDQPPAEEKK